MMNQPHTAKAVVSYCNQWRSQPNLFCGTKQFWRGSKYVVL